MKKKNRDFPTFHLQTQCIPNYSKHNNSYDHYVFRNALVVSVDFCSQQNAGDKNDRRVLSYGLTSIVVFNLSLVYHYTADRCNCQTNRTKALRLYRKSWDALKKRQSCIKNQNQLFHGAMVAAILNNMGAVSHRLSNYQHSRKCFKALQSIFLSNGVETTSLKTDARNGMMMNLFFLDEPTVAEAA